MKRSAMLKKASHAHARTTPTPEASRQRQSWDTISGTHARTTPTPEASPQRQSWDAISRAPSSAAIALARGENAAIGWMARYGLLSLRLGLGTVYFWFGALKLAPGLSPAEALVADTFKFIDPRWMLPCLGVVEMAIGLSLLSGRLLRVSLPLLLMHMSGTVLPLILLPGTTWTRFPFAPTLEGQYIVKNIIIVGAAFVLAGATRWRRVDQAPQEDRVSQTEASRPSGIVVRRRARMKK